MAIARKPKPKNEEKSNIDIESLINRGGSVASFKQTPEDTQIQTAEKPINLRLPMVLANKVDTFLQGQTIKTSRHRWILEAIAEKLDREEKKRNR